MMINDNGTDGDDESDGDDHCNDTRVTQTELVGVQRCHQNTFNSGG